MAVATDALTRQRDDAATSGRHRQTMTIVKTTASAADNRTS